jgi:uncharacterized protein YndB with AHSA1/START domain
MPEAIEREIVLPVDAEEAWNAITDPDELVRWFADEVELDLRPGGDATFRWDDGCERGALVEEVDEPRRFAFRWTPAEDGWEQGGAETRVEFTLADDPNGTRVIVVESGFAPVAGPRMAALAGRMSMLALA